MNARVIEQIVLGTILAERKAMPFVTMLTVHDFDDPHHQLVFQAAYALAEQGRHPSTLALAPQLGNDLVGETQRPLVDYLREIARSKAVPIEDISDHIRSLKEFAARRMMRALGQQMTEVADQPGISVGEFLDEVAERSATAASEIRQQRVTTFSAAQLHDDVVVDLRAKRQSALVPTGIIALDRIMGGWPRGELSILAGRPSMGKALKADEPVLLEDGTWREIGQLRVGDAVASVDGQPSRVSGVFPQGARQLYRVELSDGRAVVADGDHLWPVSSRCWATPRILTTIQIMDKLARLGYKNRISALTVKSESGIVRLDPKGTSPEFVSIVDAGVDEAVCITVTHPSKLFVTRDYIVTHNSTVATSGMRQSAFRHEQAWLLISLEMRAHSIWKRIISDQIWNSQTPLDYERIMRGDLQDYEIDRIERAGEKLRALPIDVEEQDNLSMVEIGIRARRWADAMQRRGTSIGGFIIDHLGFVQASARYRGARVHEIGEITRGAKGLAKELDCAGVVLSQLNRQSEGRDDKRPQLADLRDSGDIEQDADTIIFCYREYYYLERMGPQRSAEAEEMRQRRMAQVQFIIELICAKRRNGPVFTAKADAFMGSAAIRSMSAT